MLSLLSQKEDLARTFLCPTKIKTDWHSGGKGRKLRKDSESEWYYAGNRIAEGGKQQI